MEPTLNLVKQAISKKIGIAEETIRPETSLDELGLDSLGIFDLMFELEDKLGVIVPNDQLEVKTVQDMVDLIDRLTVK